MRWIELVDMTVLRVIYRRTLNVRLCSTMGRLETRGAMKWNEDVT
jgi:hypothetical protein